MGLINLVLKAVILVLDLRDTYHALDTVKLDEIARSERQVLVRNAQDGTKQLATRKRVGTSKRKAAVRSALTTVLVWNLFNKLEPLCDRTIAWFVPFYDTFKTLLLVWMLFTRSYGASILVFRILAPIIRPYEPVFDAIFVLALALSIWISKLLAPTAAKCAKLAHNLRSTLQQNAGSDAIPPAPSLVPAPSSQGRAPQRKASATSIRGKAGKRPPPPPSPPASNKISPASAAAASSAGKSNPQRQANIAVAKARQVLPGRASNGSLAATRRVLQELPVPSHAFDSVKTQAGPSASSPAPETNNATSGHAASGSGNNAMAVKTEPSDPTFAPSAATLGAPPTPPTGLQNYAFIPGLTPQRSGPASFASPTPHFPGGFAFSAAASTSANRFQASARVPLTTQMAPLSLASQIAAPLGAPHLRGSPNVVSDSIPTHESVTSAKDDRIVPPPFQAAVVRKVASQRSLKSKAAKSTQQNGNKAATVSNDRKRARSDDASGGEVGESEGPASSSSSPRKRVKSVAGQDTIRKRVAGSVTAAKARTKPATSTNGQAATSGGSIATRKRDGTNGTTSTATHKSTVPARSASALKSVNGNTTAGKSGSIEEKAKATTTSSKATSAKVSAHRTAVKKAPSTSKSRSSSTEAAGGAEQPPPQRLTRSRTKQNLLD
ncbi:hypothetical protein EX895_001728 [Sporisorium graminicola]|uniref:Uncharacterized protein n=1 Tax=Sporisorium graminicola TaxID=280036 RepID=A0A4U7KY51_9BASI|nr:hypothetical protein EX895_001728 [Sporisorium graminicola]TKY89197.1 hypothetical protein EX895_001728 [Sporisorium graminicola]